MILRVLWVVLLLHVISGGWTWWDDQRVHPHPWDLVAGSWRLGLSWDAGTAGPPSHSVRYRSLSLSTWGLQGSQTSYTAAQGSPKVQK